MRERSARFGWSAPNTNRAYVIELGSVPGASDVATVTTPNNADFYTIRDLPSRAIYARVKAQASGGTSGPSNEIRLSIPDFRDYVEALFLGSGPLVPKGDVDQNFACPHRGMWSGYARGSTVTVVVPQRVRGGNRAAIDATAATVPDATAGAIRVGVVDTADLNIQASDGQLIMAVIPLDQVKPNCGPGASIACITYFPYPIPSGVIRWTKAFFSVGDPADIDHPNPFAHEMGHGILGMCHLDPESSGGDRASVMTGFTGPSGISPFDIEALKAVWGSSLGLGATRGDFAAQGLVR